MIGWLVFPLFVAFYGIGYKLTLDAYEYLRDQKKSYGFTPIFRPEEFRAEGEAVRRRAVLYWRLGGVAFLLALVVLDYLT